jgi:hypothetical protein
MCNDRELAFLVPHRIDWEMTPFAVRALIVLMYQHIAEQVTVEGLVDKEELRPGPEKTAPPP